MQNFVQVGRDRKRAKGEKGFTLIELLIVIVVLGILAAVVVFAIQGVTGKSAVSACQADAKSVESAAAQYNAQNTPGLSSALANLNPAFQGGPSNSYTDPAIIAALVPNYIASWPHNDGHYYIAIDNQSFTVRIFTPTNTAGADFEPTTVGQPDGCQQIVT